MNSLIMVIIALIAAYFIGSTPAPYLAGRIFKKIDIRTVGSKNMGSMNVFYNVGFWPGILVLT
ncbi:glycerol-3-phosphate acyltransferase, partial [Dehalococcoides mccartyi]